MARVTTRVTTRHYVPHILCIVVYEPTSQRASFSIPVKSMSFKSLDYRRHRACTNAGLVSQLEHINFIPNAAMLSDALPTQIESRNFKDIRISCINCYSVSSKYF